MKCNSNFSPHGKSVWFFQKTLPSPPGRQLSPGCPIPPTWPCLPSDVQVPQLPPPQRPSCSGGHSASLPEDPTAGLPDVLHTCAHVHVHTGIHMQILRSLVALREPEHLLPRPALLPPTVTPQS